MFHIALTQLLVPRALTEQPDEIVVERFHVKLEEDYAYAYHRDIYFPENLNYTQNGNHVSYCCCCVVVAVGVAGVVAAIGAIVVI